jgi:hypothetical protein
VLAQGLLQAANTTSTVAADTGRVAISRMVALAGSFFEISRTKVTTAVSLPITRSFAYCVEGAAAALIRLLHSVLCPGQAVFWHPYRAVAHDSHHTCIRLPIHLRF